MFTFRVRVRMGIHSGPCGTAVSVKYIWKPYYFVYGHAIEIAKLMGACSEPMKIQVGCATWTEEGFTQPPAMKCAHMYCVLILGPLSRRFPR